MDHILRRIPHDFPLSERPYKEIADRIGVNEEDIVGGLESLKRTGTVRRVAAALYHRRASYTHNVMVVWKVEEQDIERVGETMASFSEVSHCYERDTGGFWDYTIYTMIHGKSMENCMDVIKRISESTGVKDYEFFLSKREFKKTSLSVENE
ncbi:MAG: Lrp/AsnC family transcriptional regulator [Syntrophus sp. (in: bacteria)]|nr:Lrp/AsnC family transcriptional regulator [Syntrophus sp. (in: bacteria)]